MKTRYETYDPDNPAHTWAAANFCVWSIESGSMLELNKDRMDGFAYSQLAYHGDSWTLLGHAAITQIQDGVATIGGYVTNPLFRGKGFGAAGLKNLITAAPKVLSGFETYQANVNAEGLSQFEKLGGVVTDLRQPPAATGCNHVVQIPVAAKVAA